jgi:hypothetical protein
MGREPGYWAKRLAREIEESGRHHTPREVAAVLIAKADELEAGTR